MALNLHPAEIYRREADRLRTMANSDIYGAVRDGLLAIANQYEVLADQSHGIHNHAFGRPLVRSGRRSS
jgi:hypothetical protein